MTLVLLILVAGLFFFLHARAAARMARIEARVAALQEELLAFRTAGQLNEGEGAPLWPEPPQVTAPAPETLGGLFERLIGGRLLIWIGGIALAAAGIFLIRHSIALVPPEARMIAAALFGLALIAAGEYARGGRLLADDPRIGQALVGAGIAILYAATYGSYLLFSLIGSGTASALMLLITAAALALSLRHGPPTALMGLVGGFLTPLLVGDPTAGALPVLATLALLDAAIFAIAWRRGWTWLAAAAVAASFAWTGYFVLEPPRDALAAGIFAAFLGIAASLPRPREGRQLSLMQPAILGLVELAVLVARPDVGISAWLLFGALAAATLPLSMLRPDHRPAPPAALLLALVLIAIKAAGGEDPLLPWAALATTLLFAGGLGAFATREQPLRALTACAALAGPLLIVRQLQPELLGRLQWGGLALLLSLGALGLLWLLRARSRDKAAPGIGSFGAAATAALLLAVAAYDLATRDFVSGAWLAAAMALLLAGVRMPDKALRLSGLGLLTATILKVFLIDAAELEGVLRILSFLALGLALIGIGKLYTRVLSAESGRSG
ncbi:MAG: DUF2339 domain-containing protein [Pseudomonadota bacterium]|nr:DUF2339 domain-containing protein [Pseudomonadota bacterium]